MGIFVQNLDSVVRADYQISDPHSSFNNEWKFLYNVQDIHYSCDDILFINTIDRILLNDHDNCLRKYFPELKSIHQDGPMCCIKDIKELYDIQIQSRSISLTDISSVNKCDLYGEGSIYLQKVQNISNSNFKSNFLNIYIDIHDNELIYPKIEDSNFIVERIEIRSSDYQGLRYYVSDFLVERLGKNFRYSIDSQSQRFIVHPIYDATKLLKNLPLSLCGKMRYDLWISESRSISIVKRDFYNSSVNFHIGIENNKEWDGYYLVIT